MEDSSWKVILAVAFAAVLQSIAYAIREWINGRSRQRLETQQSRMESKIDGNTALTATSLVSSGTLPDAAPCIPTVAKAISCGDDSSSKNAIAYATSAVAVARETMTREGIPVQNQELLLSKMKKMFEDTNVKVDDTAVKEERHSKNNAAFTQVLSEEIGRLKGEINRLKEKSDTQQVDKQQNSNNGD